MCSSLLCSLQYLLDQVLEDHSAPVICLAGISQATDCSLTSLVISGSSDCTIRIWEKKSPGVFQVIQTLDFSPGFVLGMDLYCLCGHVILACGGSAEMVDIFVAQDNKVMKGKSTLIGYCSWTHGQVGG